MPRSYIEFLKKNHIPFQETPNMEGFLKDLDILYVTRIQQERFPDPLEYEKYKGMYQVDLKTLKNAKKGLKIMHPLPRVGEIHPEVDSSDYALYFDQAANGIPVRQALIALTLGKVK